MKRVEFTIPIRTVSEANQREHWIVKNRRKVNQQEQTVVALYGAGVARAGPKARDPIELPCKVKLTRYGAKALDGDNLVGSFKHTQDAIAGWLGVDDGDTKRIAFEYRQVPNGKRQYFVRVEIESVS